MITPQWELIQEESAAHLSQVSHRLAVPGGWLIRTTVLYSASFGNVSMATSTHMVLVPSGGLSDTYWNKGPQRAEEQP